MKVLFIWTDVNTQYPTNSIHIGLAALSAFLKQAGHETSLLYMSEKLGREEFLQAMQQHGKPDLVGFSAMTNQFDYCAELAEIIDEEYDVPVVFGGHHPSLAPEEVISRKGINILCRGEGEEAMLELVERIERGEDYSDVQGLWVKKGEDVIKNPIRPITVDINDLPSLDLEVFNFEEIYQYGGEYPLHLMAGRGCPYHCTYCCNPAVNRLYKGVSRVVRTRDVDVVIAEIKQHRRNYPMINCIVLLDETFTLNKKWVLEFCKAYKAEVGLKFQILVRVNTLDEEIMDALKDAGCDAMRIGVESGSEWLRENVLKRKMTNDQIVRVFEYADKVGIRTLAFAMIGLPHETPEMIEETMALLRRIKPHFVQFSIFYPYPGTELYEECKREGWLTGEKSFSYFEKSLLNLPTISQQQIMDYYRSFNKELREIMAKKEAHGYYDFITNIDNASVKTDEENFVDLTTFFEEYGDEYWLQAHPFTEISYDVDVAKDSRLVFDIAMNPDTYEQEGGGVKFEVMRNGRKIFSKKNSIPRRGRRIAAGSTTNCRCPARGRQICCSEPRPPKNRTVSFAPPAGAGPGWRRLTVRNSPQNTPFEREYA